MIEIINMSKSFDKKIIFKDFNYKIHDGTMLAIVGKSGSGKSTLLNILGLLDHNYEGDILYDSVNISKGKKRKIIEYIRNNINYLFQNYALIENETVEYNLLLALEYEQISKKEKNVRITNVLKSVDLSDYNNKKIYTLSGGEQQRVALARIMLKRGNVILADEPTGNLDYNNTFKVIDILKSFKKEGKMVIIVTHNENIAKECDEIIYL
jgi:putative ABC transport system ATP-binding protein